MRRTGILATALLALLLAAATAPAQARDLLPNGPGVGAPIPHDLSSVDQNGQPTDFRRLKGGRGMVLLFTRSLDW